jgi:hypothetical protein
MSRAISIESQELFYDDSGQYTAVKKSYLSKNISYLNAYDHLLSIGYDPIQANKEIESWR